MTNILNVGNATITLPANLDAALILAGYMFPTGCTYTNKNDIYSIPNNAFYLGYTTEYDNTDAVCTVVGLTPLLFI